MCVKFVESMWRLGLRGSESYPERQGVPNCVYYMRTGFCGYGSRCHYNHPHNRAVVKLSSFCCKFMLFLCFFFCVFFFLMWCGFSILCVLVNLISKFFRCYCLGCTDLAPDPSHSRPTRRCGRDAADRASSYVLPRGFPDSRRRSSDLGLIYE